MTETSSQSPAKLPAIEVERLEFGYGPSRDLRVERFVLEDAQSCAVIGPSGCGKTTFVHLLAGLLPVQSGTLKILGQDLEALSETQRDRFRGRNVGLVFQQLHLIPALTVTENLKLALRLSRSEQDVSGIGLLLERLELTSVSSKRPRELSYGQAQRVAIARALTASPRLIIADEPTSALDDDNAHRALTLLSEVTRDSGASLLVVTHDHRVREHIETVFDLGAPQ